MSAHADDLACIDLVEAVTEYLEGALPAEERTRLEAHLAECEGCAEYLAQIRVTIRIAGALTPDSLSAECRAALLAAFRAHRSGAPPGAAAP